MKISTAKGDEFASRPPPQLKAALIFGPDEGMVRERSRALLTFYLGKDKDPFRFVELTTAQLREDPARLGDEAAAISFGGGVRVIHIEGATDALCDPLKAYLSQDIPDCVVIAAASDMPARAKLRKLFEDHERAAALACYPDEGISLQKVIRHTLESEGYKVEREALDFLVAHSGSDRQVTRRELEKLILYIGDDKKTIALPDVEACIGDTSMLALEDVFYALVSADMARLDKALSRAYSEGSSPITLLRSITYNITRLHQVSMALRSGESSDKALASLRPPVFWKAREPFLAAARLLAPKLLITALERFLEVEAQCKASGAMPEVLVAASLYRIATGIDKVKQRKR